MKFQYTLPKNEAFFRDYAGLTGTLKHLGYLAQLVSALTEFGVIFALVESSLVDFFPQAARPAGIFGAFIGTAFIEVGLRKFIPYSVRAMLYKRFEGLHLLITCFVFAVTLGLLLSSGYLSFAGSKELIRTTAPKPKLVNLDTPDAKEQQAREEALLQYSTDSTEAVQRFSTLEAAIRAKYTAKLATESQALNRLEAMERTGKRYTSQKATIKAKILSIQAQQAEEIAELESSKALALGAALRARNTVFGKAANEADKARQRIETSNQQAEAHNAQQVKRYGSGLAWFTVVCMVVLLFSVSIDEIHKKGSGIEEVLLPTQYYFSQGVLNEAFTMLSDKWNYHARNIIRSLAASTPQPKQPEPLAELWEAPTGLLRRKATHQHPADAILNQAESEAHREPRPVIQGFIRNTANGMSYTPTSQGIIDSSLKPCQHCSAHFKPKTTWQKYCSDDCKLAYHAAKHGKAFNPSRYHKKVKA